MFNNSQKQKALTAFKKQREKLEEETYYKDVMWVAQTTDLIKKYIGEDSSLHKVSQSFTFSVMAMHSRTDILNEINSRKEQALKLIENCIEFIVGYGVKKEPKVNFLQKIDNGTLWTIIAAIITAFSSGGYFVGCFFTKFNSEREIEKKEMQIEALTRQLKYSELLLDKLSATKGPTLSPSTQIK